MILRGMSPCARCHRHIPDEAQVCPFCGYSGYNEIPGFVPLTPQELADPNNQANMMFAYGPPPMTEDMGGPGSAAPAYAPPPSPIRQYVLAPRDPVLRAKITWHRALRAMREIFFPRPQTFFWKGMGHPPDPEFVYAWYESPEHLLAEISRGNVPRWGARDPSSPNPALQAWLSLWQPGDILALWSCMKDLAGESAYLLVRGGLVIEKYVLAIA